MAGLFVAGFLFSPFVSAVVNFVGDQAPDQNYRLLAKMGSEATAAPSYQQGSGSLSMPEQILASASLFHNVDVFGAGHALTLPTQRLVLPPGGARLPPNRRVLTQTGNSSGSTSAHPSGTSAASSLPPDPDFSYLSLLQPNLTFVQQIQGNLAQAAALAGLAAGLSATLGLAFLTARSNLLQKTFSQAWYWMMTNIPSNLPQVMTYQTTQGHSFGIYDTFASTATKDVFSSANLAALKQYLDNMPQDLLQNVSCIVNGPVPEMTSGDSASTEGDRISIEGIADVNDEALAHEIGVALYFEGFSGPLQQGWNTLWSQSTNPVWDDVSMFSYYPPRPMPSNQPKPWGAQSEVEDFASIFSNWAGDSGTPRINPNQSSSSLEEAVCRASLGHPLLLEKTLIVAALYTDQATQQLSLYHYSNYALSATASPIRTTSPVQATSTTLKLGDYTFTIQNGMLVSVSSPATPLQAALNYLFSTPVAIPAFAATRWGLQ